MKYINTFKTHASYEEKLNGGGVDIGLPNVSYCEDVKDIHYNPYNTVEFYVGNITGTTPQTVRIYTDRSAYIPIQVSEGNKWYTYLLPKNKGLCEIGSGHYDNDEGQWYDGIVTKAVVKANVTTNGNSIIPYSTVEASFKGSNTSKVTDMRYYFQDCSGLTSLDLSDFDTSNVTRMDYMFGYCGGLTSLDVSSFNTSNVTNMYWMFSGCSGLESLDVSNFDTSNVTVMSKMFSGCTSLTSLDLSNFNTSNVTDMNDMFCTCKGLTSLDLSNFNTSNVTDMGWMFQNCTSLTFLDLSKWDTSKVTNMGFMFDGCSALKTIRMVGCSLDTRTKIQNRLAADGITGFTIVTE